MKRFLIKNSLLRTAGFILFALVCLFAGFNAVIPSGKGLLSLPWTAVGVVSAEIATRFAGGSLRRLYWGLRRSRVSDL